MRVKTLFNKQLLKQGKIAIYKEDDKDYTIINKEKWIELRVQEYEASLRKLLKDVVSNDVFSCYDDVYHFPGKEN
jgi:hypothetical protein